MTRFENVYLSPRVRVALKSILGSVYSKKFWDLVTKLQSGQFDIPGLRVEKLKSSRGKIYSARLNVELRVIFSMLKNYSGQGSRSLVIWDVGHHDAAYNRLSRVVIPAIFADAQEELEVLDSWGESAAQPLDALEEETPDDEDIAGNLPLFKVPHHILTEPAKYYAFEESLDRYLRLSEEQEELLAQTDRAHIVRGSAGTGKTALALFYALNVYESDPERDVYFFTYQDDLACVCRCYKVNMLGEPVDATKSGNASGLKVFSYVEFCHHYLRKMIDSKEIKWDWIDRETSISHLTDIISSRQKWAKSLKADETYSYIYSILKGRFVPGTDKLPTTTDEFRRIFRGYGSVPENLEDILEIFGHYDERLIRLKQRDEADLIRYCYTKLKERATLSEAGKSPWIIIDELQDFTELEWKSILLFWENQSGANGGQTSFPFLAGDRNQNISRSGFRWGEVDAYIESTLKKMHRPNALEKVVLHRNFRNTKEIYELANFVRSAAPEASSDLGMPGIQHGRKPLLVVGHSGEFNDFLKEVNQEEQSLPAPLVVLYEDTQALNRVKKNLVDDDGLFLMPLYNSKGLEFEDLILYRLFSSMQSDLTEDQIARLFDLWYMALTRARQNLLIFITPEDHKKMQDLLGERYFDLLKLVDLRSMKVPEALKEFYQTREKYLPNYTIIFLERTKADEAWREFLKLRSTSKPDKDKMTQLKNKAIRLWQRARDYASLGKALMELKEYKEAIPYLTQATMMKDVGICFEKLSKYADAADAFEQAGAILDAARCHERNSEYLKAAILYEEHQEWLQAATNYYLCDEKSKAATCFELAGMWNSAADLYRAKGQWGRAAELYQRAEQHKDAAEMYLKIKNKLDAARSYCLAGEFEHAAKLYEQLTRWAEAAESYEKAEIYDKAGQAYSKAGRLKDSARCEEKAGDYLSAAQNYERMRNWAKAAEAYFAGGQRAKALECFEKNDDWDKALEVAIRLEDWMKVGRCLEHLGEFEQAADNYERVKAYNEAAYCCEKAENWTRGADLYLKAKNFSAAASVLVKLNRRMDAARLFMLSGQTAVALEVASSRHPDLRKGLAIWAEDTKRFDLAGQIYEAIGELQNAAERYRLAMMFDKAAQCYELAERFDLSAELYLHKGDFNKAAESFQHTGELAKAAQCYELLKDWDKAREIYEQMGDKEAVRRCLAAAKWL